MNQNNHRLSPTKAKKRTPEQKAVERDAARRKRSALAPAKVHRSNWAREMAAQACGLVVRPVVAPRDLRQFNAVIATCPTNHTRSVARYAPMSYEIMTRQAA